MTDVVAYSQKQIRIYVSDRKLHFVSGQDEKSYPIAVGKPATPTPPGTYKVINKVVNPGGFLGSRWLGLDIPDGPYGIHGTSYPESIGQAISNGCIRMYNHNVEELFTLVSVGTTVVIENYAGSGAFPAGNAGYSGYTEYVVRPGDTLWGIAQQYGVSIDQLVALNNITNPDLLQVGEVIKIP